MDDPRDDVARMNNEDQTMKAKAFLLFMAVAAVTVASQDAVQFARKFKEGEKDVYNMSIQASMAMGQFDIRMQIANTIKKVYDNGDADQETAVSDMKLIMNGNEMPMPGAQGQKPTLMRINKFGSPADPKTVAAGGGMFGGMDQLLSLSQRMMDKPFKVGEVIPIDVKEKNSTVKGTMKLESITEGVAKMVSDLNVQQEGAPKPMKITTTSWMDVASSKANKVEGTVTGVPSQQGMEIDSVKFVMERVK